MLAIFTTIVMSLSDAGFNDGLIRKSDCDKKDFGTIASYNLAVALFMFAVMNIAAPYIAIFFGRNELTNIARVLAIGFILKAITLTGFVQLVKQLKFKQLSQINIICSLLSFVVVYTLAIIGFGYWALALQPVVMQYSILYCCLSLENGNLISVFTKNDSKKCLLIVPIFFCRIL